MDKKLVYADRFGNEMTDVVEVTKASEWQDKQIEFNVNYLDKTGKPITKDIEITIDTDLSLGKVYKR